jgi:site-specific recombinase XerD
MNEATAKTWTDEFINRLNVSEKTKERYISDITLFFEIALYLNHLEPKSLFQASILDSYYYNRRGSTANAAIMNFLKYLYETKKLEKMEYLLIKDQLENKKKFRTTKDEILFLSESQIKYILGNDVKYRFKDQPDRMDGELAMVAPLIWALAYTGLEQKEIMALTMDDLDVSRSRIRNLKKNDNELLMDWIDIEEDDPIQDKLYNYLDYRATLSTRSNHLLILQNKPLDNAAINLAFSIFKRVENIDVLKTGDVHAQIMMRSGILSSLIATNGHSLINIVRMFGLKNAQVTSALTEYLKQTL